MSTSPRMTKVMTVKEIVYPKINILSLCECCFKPAGTQEIILSRTIFFSSENESQHWTQVTFHV